MLKELINDPHGDPHGSTLKYTGVPNVGQEGSHYLAACG